MQIGVRTLMFGVVVFAVGVVLGGLFIGGRSSAPQERLMINQATSVEHKLAPDTFSAHIVVESTKKLEQTPALSPQEENALLELLQANNALVAKAKEVCIGGEFSVETRTYQERKLINDKWSYIDHTGIFVRQGIACEFTKENAKIYEDLLNALRSNVAKSPHLRFNLPAITPIYTQDQLRAKTQAMRSEILAQAQQVAKDYSKILSTKCRITSLHFRDQGNTPKVAYKSHTPIMSDADTMGARNSLESIQIAESLPVVKDGELQLGADFGIGCK